MRKYDLKINGKEYKVEVKDFQVKTARIDVNGKEYNIDINYPESETSLTAIPRSVPSKNGDKSKKESAPAKPAGININAPMPGLILKMFVKPGDKVSIGQRVAVMEAMKMENDINSTAAGTIQSVNVREGDNVQENQSLVFIGQEE